MVKAGKFDKRGIQWAAYPGGGSGQYGTNDPIKKLWWGTLTKRQQDGTTEPVDFGGATWGFNAIEWSRVTSRAVVNGTPEDASTTQFMCHQAATLYLEATLGVGDAGKPVTVLVFGR